MPSIRAVVLVVFAVVLITSLASTGIFTHEPIHDLEGIAVNTVTNNTTKVDVQVYANGGNRLVADQTVTVPGARQDLEPREGGVKAGALIAGQTTITSGWNNPDEYVVRARLSDRQNWSRIDLGRRDEANDPPWWQRVLPRYEIEDQECFGVRVWVNNYADTGVRVSKVSCNVISS